MAGSLRKQPRSSRANPNFPSLFMVGFSADLPIDCVSVELPFAEIASQETPLILEKRSEDTRKRLDNYTDLYNIPQLSFSFLFDNIANLADEVTQFSAFVPRSLRPFMEMSFGSLIAGDVKLLGIAQKLYGFDIIRTGDVVRLSAQQIQEMTQASSDDIAHLEDFLASSELRLRLGSRIPGWRPGYPGNGRGV